MFKHLRDSKAKTSGKLARLMGKGGAKDAKSGDNASITSTRAKRETSISVDGKAAKARLDRPGRKMRAAGGVATSKPDDDSPVQEAGIVDSVARGAMKLFGRGATAAPKEPIPGLSREASDWADKRMPSLRKFTDQEKNWTPEYRAKVQKHIDAAKKAAQEDRKSGGRVRGK